MLCLPLRHVLLAPGHRQVYGLLPWVAAHHWVGAEVAAVLQSAYQQGRGGDPETAALEGALLRWIPVVGGIPLQVADLPPEVRHELWGEGVYLRFLQSRVERVQAAGRGVPLLGLGSLVGILQRAGFAPELAWRLDLADLVLALRDPESASLDALGDALEQELAQNPELEAAIWPTQERGL